MVRTRLLATLICLSLLAACATPFSEVPLATNFPTSNQQKLQAAAHWNAIAMDVAKQLSTRLKDKRPLFVNLGSPKTAFDKAFANDLVSALIAEGFTVQKNPTGALNVDVDTQAVRFSPNRPQYRHFGEATALMTGVWALRNVSLDTSGQVLGAGIAIAAAADTAGWVLSEFATGETPQTEIILTTSISDANQYIARNTSIYYVADSDRSLYVHEPPTQVQSRNFGVTGQ